MDMLANIWILLAIATGSVICILQAPEQVHLSLGTSRDIMVVMWAHGSGLPGTVNFGFDPGQLPYTANATIAEMPPFSRQAVRYVYRAEMKGLQGGGTYYYVITVRHPDTAELGTSELFSFRAVDDQKATHRYLVYGDFGHDPGIPTYSAILAEVTSQNYTAIWHNGDFAYDLFAEDGKIGDQFMRQIQPFASRIPYMTVVGNHEIEEVRAPFVQYGVRFSMPGAPWPMPTNRLWYSYDIGDVHFISYSTEVFFTYNYDIECQQFNWLKEDLIAANTYRHWRPWIVAMGHRPMYCSVLDVDCYAGMKSAVRNGLEELFYSQGVDLIIESHEHLYRRLWPVYRETVLARDYLQPRAPVHLITGAAGSKENGDSKQSDWDNAWSAFSVGRKGDYSFGILTVHNRSHIQFQQKSAESNTILDDFYIVQDKHGPFIEGVYCTGSNVHTSCNCPAHTPVLWKPTVIVTDILYSLGLWIILIPFVFYLFCKWRKAKQRRYSGVKYEPVAMSMEEKEDSL